MGAKMSAAACRRKWPRPGKTGGPSPAGRKGREKGPKPAAGEEPVQGRNAGGKPEGCTHRGKKKEPERKDTECTSQKENGG